MTPNRFPASSKPAKPDIEFEQSGYIDMNRHTKQYITLITDMASDIIGDVQAGEIRKMIKMYTRGRM